MTSKRAPRKAAVPTAPSPDELQALWEARGPEAIRTLRTYDPGAYIRAIAALIGDDD